MRRKLNLKVAFQAVAEYLDPVSRSVRQDP
jgi:hypothetical protein